MIYSVKGTLIHIESGFAVVECGGIGYKVNTTLTTQKELKLNSTVMLYTYMNVREDAVELFGFYTKGELSTFKLLISVSGVGPKVALAILSELSSETIALSVSSGDYKTLTRASGVGPKLAQRIVLELKDKASKMLPSGVIAAPDDIFSSSSERSVGSDSFSEAIGALVSLGYNRSEAVSALSGVDSRLSSDDMIREALRKLARM